jgi:hypothetical protein
MYANEEDGYGKSKHNCNTWRSLLFRLKTTGFVPCTGPSSGLKWSVRGVYTVQNTPHGNEEKVTVSQNTTVILGGAFYLG